MEYDYAVSKGMKVIALVHGEPNHLPRIKCESDLALQEKLEEFREKVCTGRLVKFWTNLDQISGIVSLSLTKTIKTYPAIGWVRADLIPSENTTQEILLLRNQVKELEITIQNLKMKPEGIEKLSQGDDFIGLHIYYRANKIGNDYAKKGYSIPVNITWNEIFRFLSPTMIVENSEENLLKLLGECIERSCITAIRDFVKKNELENVVNRTAYGEDLRLIIVQFRALKLIELSTKKHSASDTNIYWKLTPYGDQLMTELNAIQKVNN